MKKIKRLVLSIIAVITSISCFAEDSISFDGYLVLIELVSVAKLDPSEVGPEHIIKKGLVHQPIGKVIEVYVGPEEIVGSLFPMTPPPHLEGQPEDLTHTDLAFDGVFHKKTIPVGSRALINLHYRENFDPMSQKFNPFDLPDRSVFYTLYGSSFAFDTGHPALFKTRFDWAEAIKQFNRIEEGDDRIVFLKEAIHSENPLLAVSAVHLLNRFYPQSAEEYFDEIVLAAETPFYARLAIDHEFLLSRGQAWVKDKQKELESILGKEASSVSNGEFLLSFRKQMIDNGSWFGGLSERQ